MAGTEGIKGVIGVAMTGIEITASEFILCDDLIWECSTLLSLSLNALSAICLYKYRSGYFILLIFTNNYKQVEWT